MDKIKSMAMRASFMVVAFVTIIFGILISSNIYFAIRDIEEKEHVQMYAETKYLAYRLINQVQSIESSVEAHEQALRHYLRDGDDVGEVMRDLLRRDKRLIECNVGLEPDHFLAKTLGNPEGLMYRAYREGDSIAVVIKPNDYHFQVQSFYFIPKHIKRNYWTEPVMSNGARIITFSHPLLDNDGRMFALLSVDLPLEVLVDTLQTAIKDDNAGFVYAIGKSGRYMVHPNSDFVLNETFVTNSREHDAPKFEAMCRKALAGASGTQYVEYGGKNFLDSYMYVNGLGWMVGIAKSWSAIVSDILKGVGYSILTFIVCMALLTLVMYKLMKQLTNMTAVKESFEKELFIAHDIQMGMLPRIFPAPPAHPNIDVFAYLNPAKEVGGDLYDIFLKKDKLHFIIGDVSGKGVPASLVMAITISLFRSMDNACSPVEVVTRINNSVAANNERNMFVTLIVGELDLETGHLCFCNAGHDPMLLLTEGSVERIPMLPNLPVGLMEDFPYRMNETDIKKGERLLLYTDGVAEAENPDKNLYTIERLMSLAEKLTDRSSRELIDSIQTDVTNFASGADQSDDITIMAIHYM